MKHRKHRQAIWGAVITGALGGAVLASPFALAFGGTTGSSTYSGGSGTGYSTGGTSGSSTDSWTPASGYQQNLSSSIASNTSGFQSTGTSGQYTYNSCASQGGVIAYNAATGKAYCKSGNTCPPGESQINGDGVCQGTGSNNAGSYAQWTFSACQNGTQTETSHNPYTDAVTSTSQVSCVANSPASANPANTSGSSSSTTAPSCSPSSSTSYGGTSWTGCASQGVESGTQSYTVYHSCPSYTTNGSRALTQSTSTTCQSVVEHQCAYAKPGYAQSETCLTSPLGGTTNCSGWSTPYYDPHDCPIPTPVNY